MSGAYRPPDRNYTITTGVGVNNPKGRRLNLSIDDLCIWLRTTHPAETWFSGIFWNGDHRAKNNYEGADMVALDFDWGPAHKEGATEGMPAAEQAKVLEVVQCALTPARFAYCTPRGMRLLVLCDESIPSAAIYSHYAAKAQRQAYETLLAEGCSPLLTIDAGNTQGSRMMWVPCIASGRFKRSGRVIESEDGLTIENPKALMEHAIAQAKLDEELEAEHRRQQEKVRLERELKFSIECENARKLGRPEPKSWGQAHREFEARYASEVDSWPKRTERGYCPICGSPDAFSVLSEEKRLWACRSERHADIDAGLRVSVGRVGGILDIVAWLKRMSATEALRDLGFLPRRHK